MSDAGLELELLAEEHSVCRLPPGAELPGWARAIEGAICASVRTDEELSLVCADRLPPAEVRRSRGWRALRVAGTLDHGLTGVLVRLASPLAEAGVPIFAISSFDTDYLLVPGDRLEAARAALAEAGHGVWR